MADTADTVAWVSIPHRAEPESVATRVIRIVGYLVTLMAVGVLAGVLLGLVTGAYRASRLPFDVPVEGTARLVSHHTYKGQAVCVYDFTAEVPGRGVEVAQATTSTPVSAGCPYSSGQPVPGVFSPLRQIVVMAPPSLHREAQILVAVGVLLIVGVGTSAMLWATRVPSHVSGSVPGVGRRRPAHTDAAPNP